MPYFEQPPNTTLQAYIHTYGELRLTKRRDQAIEERILPLPGKCVVFHWYGQEPLYVKQAGQIERLPPVYITGQGCPEVIWSHQGEFGLFFILFKPRALEKLLNIEEHSLLAWKDKTKLLKLCQLLKANTNFSERVYLVESFFLDHCHCENRSPTVVQTIMEMIEEDPAIKLQELSALLQLGKRQLRRTFKGELGLTIKDYQQIVRMSRCMHQLVERRYRKISDVAYKWGFYDQTHFNETFKKYTGLTPRRFLTGDFPLMSSLFWKERRVAQGGIDPRSEIA